MNYHSILGIKQGASKDEIRKAYRTLAKQYHPDKNPSASAKQKFIEITEAYDALMSGRGNAKVTVKKYSANPVKNTMRTTTQRSPESKLNYHAGLHRKFMDLRAKYNHPNYIAQKKKELYSSVQRKMLIAAGIVVGINL